MAATGFSPVYIYASGTTGNIPSASSLTNTTTGSEIALNYFDGKLFYKNASNSVVTVPLLQSNGSQNGWLSSTDWTTFNGKQTALVSGTNIKTVNGTSLLGSGDVGTIDVSHGGTGLTSITSGYIPYGNGTGNLNINSGLQYTGTNLQLSSGIYFNSGSSSLLSDYEYGTWTPIDSSGDGLTFSSASGEYVKIGKLVYVFFRVVFPATVSATGMTIGGLPFTSSSIPAMNQGGGGPAYQNAVLNIYFGLIMGGGTTTLNAFTTNGTQLLNSNFSTADIRCFFTYFSA